jgi:hypothetical protein
MTRTLKTLAAAALLRARVLAILEATSLEPADGAACAATSAARSEEHRLASSRRSECIPTQAAAARKEDPRGALLRSDAAD